MIDQMNYEEVLEGWKVDVLVGRAKRLGLKGHDLEDAIQEIILDVIAFRFDPEKSNGASEQTALTAVIDNRLMAMLRTGSRYQKHLTEYQKTRESQYDPEQENMIAVDVRAAMSDLPAKQKRICGALGEGYSTHQIAQALGSGWHQVDRAVQEIRDHFQDHGLDDENLDSK